MASVSSPRPRADPGAVDTAAVPEPPASTQLLKDANERLVLATLRAQEMLEAAEAFRLLVESVEDYAIFMLDAEGRVANWNAGAERVHGYAAHEILGQPFAALYFRESSSGSPCARDLAVAEEAGRFEGEGMRKRKDGSTFWATVIITPLRDEGGQHLGFATATRDMTEHLRAEQEHVRLARAEENERRKDEFLAIMGHELRNPLAPMVTAMQLIKLRGGRQCEKQFAVIDRQLKQMMHLVDELLDVSRALHNQVELSPATIEMSQVLASALDVASPLLQEKHHRVEVEVPATGLLVRVDPHRMVQVFGNLLNNAAKYTDSGGDIHVRAIPSGDRVEVTIADTGTGIPPELMPRIFELFTQGEQGIERQLGGLGIGLAIARRLVNAHHGQITAHSDGPGKGSRFTVRLPGVVREFSAESLPTLPERSNGPAKRVLIVDDNEDATEMLSALLQGRGHETRVALDGLHALEIAHDFRPNIVFLDIGLPKLDGFQVVRRMRKIPACARIPIIAVTGYARDSDRQRALQAGFSDHLVKPVDLAQLELAVEMAPERP
jgi:PAS domain S-box-containing protein